MLKSSRYNHFILRDDGVLGYNARTGSFALFTAAAAEKLRCGRDLEGIADLQQLLEMGFLCDSDELALISSRYESDRCGGRQVELTIIPTLRCNRACYYCYQMGCQSCELMRREVRSDVVSLVGRMIEGNEGNLRCTWYGGEPLLCADVILEMMPELRKTVNEAGGCLSRSTIVTNGALLTEEMARELARTGVDDAQITFDAVVDDGMTRRGVLDSEGKDSLILRNARNARQYLDVRVRINVTAENAGEMESIVSILTEHGFGGKYYLSRAYDFCVGASNLWSCADAPSWQIDATSYARLENLHFFGAPGGEMAMVRRLTPKSHFCSVTRQSMLTVDPEGSVTRCWHDVGLESEKVGDARTLKEEDLSELGSRWVRYSPLAFAECRQCSVLPLCMGGCPHLRMLKSEGSLPCESLKESIKYCLEQIGKRLVVAPEMAETLVGR